MFTREEIEKQVAEDYDEVVGKVVLARFVECGHPEAGNVTVICEPPAVVRVEAYQDGSDSHLVRRWMDWENCDPVYNISLLEAHPAITESGAVPSWIYGTSRWLSGGMAPGGFTIADEALQELYGDADPVEWPDTMERSEAPFPSAPI